MQLVLTHKEIAAAIRAYVISQSNADPSLPITVQIREGRKGNGGTAIVDFEMNNLDDSIIEFTQKPYRPEDAVELARQEIASILAIPTQIEITGPVAQAYNAQETDDNESSDTSYEDNSLAFTAQSVQPEPTVEITQETVVFEPENGSENWEIEVTKTVTTSLLTKEQAAAKPRLFDDEDEEDDMFAQADKRDQELFGDKKSIFDL